ncbi:MAG: hypothetical protein M1829_002250 [Trizodia sp. TS-e1964]|nr:MAG: hypothetical protein M1829_002250 [Trizodia sp. TS-e1964]
MAQSEVFRRLNAHFNVDISKQNERWCSLWDAGDFLPWDRGRANLGLQYLLLHRPDILGLPFGDGQDGEPGMKKTALVPGCGRGYDVFLLARFGFHATGLDVSKTALEKCVEYAQDHPDECGGKWDFTAGDFFAPEFSKGYDLIYDYTFLSALPPALRPAWALRMSQLLHTNGILICVEFPSTKDPASGGPPWALPPNVYEAHLARPGIELPYKKDGTLDMEALEPELPGGFERVLHLKPEETPDGRWGTDWVSVWKRRST